MLKLFYRAKRLKKEQRGSPAPIYTAFLSIVLCMVCLAGTTWAWFTANQAVGIDPISSALFTVDVTVTDGATPLTGTSEGNVRFYTLDANGTYTVKLTPTSDSTATTGYCLVVIDDTVYYTSAITQENRFSFTYQTGIDAPDGLTKSEYENLLANTEPTNLTIAWYWGTYPNTLDSNTYSPDPGYTLLKNGAVLGTAPGEAPLEAELALNLADFDLGETEDTIPLCEDYALILTPNEGYELPEVISVEIDEEIYKVYTDGLEHREIPVDEDGEPDLSLLPPMPTFDPTTNTLTIPAVLLPEDIQAVTITATAVEIEEPECICETKCTELNGDCPVCKDSLDSCMGTEVEETDPTEETTDPTETTDPADETDPTDTTDPTESTEATEPSAPTEPVTTEPVTTEPPATTEPVATDPPETTAATEPPTTTAPVTTEPPATTETVTTSEEVTEPTEE